MADRINSGKKIEYAKQVGEALAAAKSDIQKSVSTLRSMCDDVRFATADRCYNEIAKISNTIISAINEYATGIVEGVLTPLVSGQGGHMSGEALNAKVAATIPDLEAIAAGDANIDMISDSVISGRGLDENWTESKKNAFGEECKYFIGVRAKLMAQVADISNKCAEEDTKVTYQNFGRKFEGTCNSVVAAYNGLKEQLAGAGILLTSAIEAMEQAYTAIKTDTAEKAKDIIGGDLDV